MSIIKSFRDAVNGIINTVPTERNLKIHTIAMICVIALGLIVELSQSEWIVCIILFAIVISAELFNTALERTLDYINEDYSRACFRIRNEWMVNHAARVIAVFNGEKGGTKNTIDYAVRTGIPVHLIKG